MPAKWPNHKYILYSFEVYSLKKINEELDERNLDYRDIVSITWIGTQVDGFYKVFYGQKRWG